VALGLVSAPGVPPKIADCAAKTRKVLDLSTPDVEGEGDFSVEHEPGAASVCLCTTWLVFTSQHGKGSFGGGASAIAYDEARSENGMAASRSMTCLDLVRRPSNCVQQP
jgi:hypothetical protein